MNHVQNHVTNATLAAALLAAGLAGCAASNQPAPTNAGTVTQAEVSSQQLTDGQIVGIVAAIDAAEIGAGKLAMSHATGAAARQFAEHMMSAHTSMDSSLMTVAHEQDITVARSALCEKLKSDNQAEAQTLASLPNGDFDRKYLTAQLKGHEDVLGLLDDKLIPMAENAKLKAALEDARGKVVEHIRMAKEALASVGS
ncbi:MAG: DUF4142 domain-containing protein [Polyangiaceae bacterium]|jgi:putative membrane protein